MTVWLYKNACRSNTKHYFDAGHYCTSYMRKTDTVEVASDTLVLSITIVLKLDDVTSVIQTSVSLQCGVAEG